MTEQNEYNEPITDITQTERYKEVTARFREEEERREMELLYDGIHLQAQIENARQMRRQEKIEKMREAERKARILDALDSREGWS